MRLRRVLGLFVALVMTACGSAQKMDPVWDLPNPNRNLHIHLTGGDDPTHLFGRFMPNGLAYEDQIPSMTMQTECTAFIRHKESNANITRDEVFTESSSFGANISGPVGAGVGDAGGGVSSGSIVRIKYKISKVMDYEVTDPKALTSCCQNNPGQCTDLFIGHFVYGSGEIYRKVGSLADFDGGLNEAVTMGLDAKWGMAWEQSTAFEDTYFGYELTPLPKGDDGFGPSPGDICSTKWWTSPPLPSGGKHFFVGRSSYSKNKEMAQTAAEESVRAKVVKYIIGDYITEKFERSMSSQDRYAEDSDVMRSATDGVARRVEILCYSEPMAEPTPEGEVFEMLALGMVRDSDRDQLAEDALKALIKAETDPNAIESLTRTLTSIESGKTSP